MRATTAALSTADGRWAMLSTSMTALVAGAITLLAIGATPPTSAYSAKRERSLLPYQLFMQLAAHSGSGAAYSSFVPSGEIKSNAGAQRGAVAPMDGAIVD